MDMFESTLENMYLLILILSFILTVLYFLFGEAFNEISKISPFLNPSLMLPFLIFFSGIAYTFQRFTDLPVLLIAAISIAIAFVLCACIYYFILIPRDKADDTK